CARGSGSMDHSDTRRPLVGRAALVTGAARGIGLAIAERLLADGARVALADVDLATASREAGRLGGEALALALDVTDPESVAACVAAAEARLGAPAILVNCAGIAGRSAPLWELSDADWRSVLDVDLTGVFFCCRAVVPRMREQRYGRIV